MNHLSSCYMKSFSCDICGKKHDIIGGFSLIEPLFFDEMTPEERNIRIQKNELFYEMDNRFLLTKGEIVFKVREYELFIYLEVWVRIELEDFLKKTGLLSGKLLEIEGKLFEPAINYWDSKGTKVILTFDLDGKIKPPNVIVLGKENELGKDCHDGISFEKAISWSKKYYHGK
jgi:hypothetical protein